TTVLLTQHWPNTAQCRGPSFPLRPTRLYLRHELVRNRWRALVAAGRRTRSARLERQHCCVALRTHCAPTCDLGSKTRLLPRYIALRLLEPPRYPVNGAASAADRRRSMESCACWYAGAPPL